MYDAEHIYNYDPLLALESSTAWATDHLNLTVVAPCCGNFGQMNPRICTFAWGSLKLQYKLANQDTLETRKRTQKKERQNTRRVVYELLPLMYYTSLWPLVTSSGTNHFTSSFGTYHSSHHLFFLMFCCLHMDYSLTSLIPNFKTIINQSW